MAFDIIPAVLGQTKEEMYQATLKVGPLHHTLHIDTADGVLVPHKAYPYTEKERHGLLPEYAAAFSVHLMVQHPFEIAEKYIAAGAKEVYVHVESFESDTLLLRFFHAFGNKVRIGLVLEPKTDVERIVHALMITHATRAMVMTLTDIGRQGSSFDPSQLKKISAIRNAFPNSYIIADGSVNATNIYDVQRAGANGAVVGSALMRSTEPGKEYARLQALVS